MILRDETEWVVLVENGFHAIAIADKDTILDCYSKSKIKFNFDLNLYDLGKASRIILEKIISYG
jgi:hypothetical protein